MTQWKTKIWFKKAVPAEQEEQECIYGSTKAKAEGTETGRK